MVQFISNISHHLRTPITAIGSFIELLKNDHQLIESNQTYITSALTRLNQMEQLILELITISQISDINFSIKLEAILVDKVLKQVVESYQE